MAIDGPLVICDRADHMPGRTFDGSVAQLSIFDAALTETDVRTPLFCTYPAAYFWC